VAAGARTTAVDTVLIICSTREMVRWRTCVRPSPIASLCHWREGVRWRAGRVGSRLVSAQQSAACHGSAIPARSAYGHLHAGQP